ncbi:hypothetical protein Hypma_013905 [Hypsizygus marmoreus]|uniref:Uncharacterized protein n=1 Tax=Hypsizygus marmoreus TaxID=39966 RepID=A0A369K844_HYPMA|nr:hypothetical protein Hypma_013905 [Hypsizygus marmoreus]
MTPRSWVSLTPILLLICVCVDAVTLTHEFRENDLTSGCRFNLGAQIFDLCPILRRQDVIEVPVNEKSNGPQVVRSGRSYGFAFGGKRDDRKCTKGTWIRLSETRGADNPQHQAAAPTVHTPVAGIQRFGSPLVDEGINVVASVLDDDDPSNSHLTLFFNGGFHEGRLQHARIEFICDPSARSTQPSFSSERYGVHSFIWATKYACPIRTTNTAPSNSNMHTLESETEDNTEPNPDPDGQPKDDGQELLDPLPHKPSRRWIPISLLMTGSVLIILSVLLASPNKRFILLSHLKALPTTLGLTSLLHSVHLPILPRSLPFRAGESSLVRWAQEDMALGLMDVERNEEADVMVNGGIGDDDWNGEGLDEYIPLKAGSVRSLRNYGSAHGMFR